MKNGQDCSSHPRLKLLLSQYIALADSIQLTVQKRQFQNNYEYEHYAAAVFLYEREYATQIKDHSTIVCIVDKH